MESDRILFRNNAATIVSEKGASKKGDIAMGEDFGSFEKGRCEYYMQLPPATMANLSKLLRKMESNCIKPNDIKPLPSVRYFRFIQQGDFRSVNHV